MGRIASGRAAMAAMIATVIVGGAVFTPKYEAALAAPSASRPNILLIVSDDQAWSAFDRQLMPTVFSQLVDQGILFRRAYVNTSLCCPSRSEIMTGLYEHHTGVDANDAPLLRPTLPQSLHDAGYHTMLAGKYLNSWPSCDPRPEFDRSLCVAGEEPSGLSLLNPYINVDGTWTQFTRWQTDVLSEQAADFINTTPVDQPFFVMYTPMSPHLPADDTRYQDMAVTPPRPPSFDVNMLTGRNPLYARRGPLTPEEIATADDHFVHMAHSARSLDDSVATLLNSLGDRADNTLVIYLSDNGFLYGEHRRFGKNDAWEESVRVPMTIRYPALLPGSQSYGTDALAQNVDVASTIADVAGIPWAADGRSLVPLLMRDRSRVRSAALIERCRADTRGQALCSGTSFDGDSTWPSGYEGVVTERFKYVEYDDGTRQLIDLKKDPNELVNLIAVPRFRQTVIRLRAQLRALMGTSVQTTIATGPRGRSSSKSPVFTYFSPSRFSTYRCRLTQDGKSPAWHPCGAEGETLGPLADGHYTFAVAGTDENGRVDPTPASRSFTITSSGPHVEITAHPPSVQVGSSARFVVSQLGRSSRVLCRLAPAGTGGPWTSCDQLTFDGLPDGDWLFEAMAQDADTGEWTSPPAAWPFRVDATGPAFLFAKRPDPATRAASARFSFAPSEVTSGRWSCALDGRAPVACTNGHFQISRLRSGNHRLVVRATDLAGNVATTTYEWTVDRSAPEIGVGGKPGSISTSTEETFGLSSPGVDDPRFLCTMDGRPPMPCASAVQFSGLKAGKHTFTAWAIDAAGNRSIPFIYSWKIVAAAASS